MVSPYLCSTMPLLAIFLVSHLAPLIFPFLIAPLPLPRPTATRPTAWIQNKVGSLCNQSAARRMFKHLHQLSKVSASLQETSAKEAIVFSLWKMLFVRHNVKMVSNTRNRCWLRLIKPMGKIFFQTRPDQITQGQTNFNINKERGMIFLVSLLHGCHLVLLQ